LRIPNLTLHHQFRWLAILLLVVLGGNPQFSGHSFHTKTTTLVRVTNSVGKVIYLPSSACFPQTTKNSSSVPSEKQHFSCSLCCCLNDISILSKQITVEQPTFVTKNNRFKVKQVQLQTQWKHPIRAPPISIFV
jgi:hypothetical protein